VLDGSSGNDILIGGNGPDVLIGGPGDTLIGANGPKTLLFRSIFGADKLSDFNLNNDAIQIDKSVFPSVSDLLNHTRDTAAGAVIDDGLGDKITLIGVTTAQDKRTKQTSKWYEDVSHITLRCPWRRDPFVVKALARLPARLIGAGSKFTGPVRR
jgi:Ca2+-binding RTX toxin-like protein